jgi:zinc protease
MTSFSSSFLLRGWRATVFAVCLAVGSVAAGHADAQPRAGKPAAGKKPHARPEPGARRAAAAHDGPRPPASVERDLAAPPVAQSELRIERVTLDNGLRLVLAPDPSMPGVAIAMAYRAGSGLEAVGQQGAARAVASLMAAGATGRITASQRAALLAEHHATESMTVDRDVAVFVTVLPAAAIELGIWLESSRVNDLMLDDEHLANVQARASEDPVEQARRRAESIAYQGFWPYEHDDRCEVDEGRPSLEAVRDFHAAHYGLASATLVLTGSFDPNQAAQLARSIRSSHREDRAPPPSAQAALPNQTNQRTARIDVGATEPQGLLEGWTVPTMGQPDHEALKVAATILHDRARFGAPGHADRLGRLDSRTTVEARLDPRVGPAFWTIAARVAPGVDLDTERSVIDSAIDELGRLGPTPQEMRLAWGELQRASASEAASLQGRAVLLARSALLRGDAEAFLGDATALVRVSRDDVRRAVARYLSPARRNVVEVRGPAPDRAPVVQPPAPAAQHAGTNHGGKPANKKKPATPKKKPTTPKKKPTPRGGKQP